MPDQPDPLSPIRRALGRTRPLDPAPIPPAIDEYAVRLVHTDFGLPDLFTARARANGMDVEKVELDQLNGRLAGLLRERACGRLGLPDSKFLHKLAVPEGLSAAGFEVVSDPAQGPIDASVTDAFAAVAESGSVVLRPGPGHGRWLSLGAPLQVIILQPRDFVADLLDLARRLRQAPVPQTLLVAASPRVKTFVLA